MSRTPSARVFPALLVLLTVVFGALVASPAAAARTIAAAPTDDAFANALDAQVPELLQEFTVPGVVITRIQSGAVAWTKAFGTANKSRNTAMGEQTVFDMSVQSTLVTAWAALHLADEGKVDINAPVESYLKTYRFPKSPDYNASLVTVRQLLSHTGGLNTNGYQGFSPRRTIPTLRQLLDRQGAYFPRLAVVYAPGGDNRYSSGGYAVLQQMIEDVTGESFATYVTREIMQPLGMTGSGWSWTPALKAVAATPYSFRGRPVPYYTQVAQAALGLIGTVPDMARFLAAAAPGPAGEPVGRGILRPETVAKAIAGEQGTGGNMGLGYGLYTLWNGTNLLMMSGNSLGWQTGSLLDPATGSGIVVAVNSQRGYPLVAQIQDMFTKAVFSANLFTAGSAPTLQPENDPLAPISLGIAGVVFLTMLVQAWFFLRDLRAGRRSWQHRPSGRGLFGAILSVIFALAWTGWFYGPLPQPLPISTPEIYAPPELAIATAALLLSAALNVVISCCPKRPRTRFSR